MQMPAFPDPVPPPGLPIPPGRDPDDPAPVEDPPETPWPDAPPGEPEDEPPLRV